MILDAQNLFSDDQDISQTAGTYVSTNVIDFTTAGIDAGAPLHLWIQITEAVTSAGSATVQFAAYTDSDEAFGTEVLMCDTPAIAKGTLVAGYQASISFVPRNVDRYVRLKYVIGTATTTAGTVSAGIVLDNQAGEAAE